MEKIKVGLYGTLGHQAQGKLVDHPRAELTAVAAFPEEAIPEALRSGSGVTRYASLHDMLADDRLELISLCSPRRCDQAREAMLCLEAGKHVYAEKPCALVEEDLDALVATAQRTGRCFHEMAGTVFAQPYWAMCKVVQSGEIGEVVQVFAQKSYPYRDRRPQDEDVDGGLTMQAGVHALRFIEHITGIRVEHIEARETLLGNPKEGGLRMAASMTARLENGGLAVAIANYLNQSGLALWGYDVVRIFGTRGFVEASAPGGHTRLIVGDDDRGALDTSEQVPDYFDRYLHSLRGGPPMPLSMEQELHPTRMVIRAKRSVGRLRLPLR